MMAIEPENAPKTVLLVEDSLGDVRLTLSWIVGGQRLGYDFRSYCTFCCKMADWARRIREA